MMANRDSLIALAAGILALGAACDSDGPGTGSTTVANACASDEPGTKCAWFGDLHIHTSYSLDAYFFNATNDPRDAIRFAKGEPACNVPNDGNTTDPYTCDHEMFIDRPLDFVAVTDHAEFLGGWVYLCEGGPDGGLPQGSNPVCEAIAQNTRDNIRDIVAGGTPPTSAIVLGLGDEQRLFQQAAWQETRRINDEEYQPGLFTTLHAYEFSSNKNGQMLHRNVVFLGDDLPDDVYTSADLAGYVTANDPNVNDEWGLLDHLKTECIDVEGCDAVTIPHSSNLSDGRMFLPPDPLTGIPVARDALPLTPEDARLRRDMDRLVEIMQHKGQSECVVGLNVFRTDEESGCDLEPFKQLCAPSNPTRPAECGLYCATPPDAENDAPWCRNLTIGNNNEARCLAGTVGPNGVGEPENCTTEWDMARNSYVAGMRMRDTLGVNPYQGGFIGSSDNHNGTAGATQEAVFEGHTGLIDNEPKLLLGFWACTNEADGGDPEANENCENREFLDWTRNFNPGGLAGFWAPENTRESLFDAMKRREAFGTSGTRMQIRSLASWESLDEAAACAALDEGRSPVDTGAVDGVPMGSVLPGIPDGAGAPSIAVWALQDPLDDPAFGRPEAVPLQRIEIVKGWVENGELRTRTIPIAATSGAVVPPNGDCTVDVGTHPERLCAVWSDPDFDPAEDAYYYARALEIPTCRYSGWYCRVHAPNAPVDCAAMNDDGVFPEETGWRGFEGCCVIEREADGLGFAAQHGTAFDVVEERAWASPIWYETD